MANDTILQVKLPNGTTYDIVDSAALHGIATVSNLGGVKAGGDGISIAADGTISSFASITATYDATDKEVILNVGTLADADITEY